MPEGILCASCTGTTTLSTNHYDHCHGQMGVSLLENKAELQLVEITILIGQFESDRACYVQLRKSIPSILSEKHNRFTFLNLVIMRYVDRLTDSVNMISNVQTTPWHWYSVQGLLK